MMRLSAKWKHLNYRISIIDKNKMEYFLRRYEHMAEKEHWCDRCCTYIRPGEIYEGMVYADKRFGIVVHKFHVHPSCELPLDPEEEKASRNNELEVTASKAA